MCALLCLQYVVEPRFVGEVEQGMAGAEIVGVKERVVNVAAPGPACPVNAGMLCCVLPGQNALPTSLQPNSVAITGMHVPCDSVGHCIKGLFTKALARFGATMRHVDATLG